MASQVLLLVLLAIICSVALASDPSPLQDFCVAVPNSPVLVNGFVCKDPNLVEANDFFFSGLNITGNTANGLGVAVTPVFTTQLPGLNTLGIAMARIDFAPLGVNPPHTHPRASEILTVLKGSLEVGFVTSNPGNRLIKKVLHTGDVFVFPQGLVHFQRNVGHGSAVALASLSSQNPGVITIANAVFGSKPAIPSDVLAKAFQVDENVVAILVNGFVCKDRNLVEANDFFFSGLNIAGNTANGLGVAVTPVFATQLPGLNTLGIAMARIDFAPLGVNPPHTHPRASEILTVLKGSLEVGFVTSNPGNRLIKKVLHTGDVFVFPQGLVHFQRNVGHGSAVALASLSSQNPGVITIANAVFGSKPAMPSDVLAKAFQVDENVIASIESKF
ncbi:hypothetical protein Vadar_002711 [Vaccinium darrowii]|uniref:Uncharacterized protein n=1 Tax=Vaccinium darrowii TaxID=229202 RepID=A0ACB7X7J4_9ERIC|nr:hypothetical protein Vadar_002711 [Vaccinium darrowii]